MCFRSPRRLALGLSIFFSFWSVAVIVMIVLVGGQLARQHRTLGYSPTDATVTSSGVEVDTSGESTAYRPKIEYGYTVDGREYTSNRISHSSWSSTRDRSKRFADAHPPGSTVRAFYDPSNPGSSVLRVGINGGDLALVAFAGVFTMVAILGWGCVVGLLMSDPATRVAGFRVVHDGAKTFAPSDPGLPGDRDPRITRLCLFPVHPWLGAGGAFTAVLFVSVFVLLIGFQDQQSIFPAAICFGVAVVAGATTYVSSRKAREDGTHEIVIDRRTGVISLPGIRSLKLGRSTTPIAEIRGVAVFCVRAPDSDSDGTYRVELIRSQPFGADDTGVSGVPVHATLGQKSASELATWLALQLGLAHPPANVGKPERPTPTFREAMRAVKSAARNPSAMLLGDETDQAARVALVQAWSQSGSHTS
ncbi:MAG: DUF3592 domain-containing protein [Planctomycetota bacterium]|nr:DUF3592 domain-containing protein [Planctomycetota bacterium]